MVRKCRLTGEIFEESNLQSYAEHLRNLRAERADEKRMHQIALTYKQWLYNEKLKITHPDQIVPWFLANQRKIMDAVNAGVGMPNTSRRWVDKNFISSDKFESMDIRLTYNYNASNSHVHPENGVPNWCNQDKNLPSGYPGWQGMISSSLKRNACNDGSYPTSAAFNIVGLLTGTGGGANKSYLSEVTIFLQDWPGLQEGMERDIIVQKLKGI